MSTTLWVSDSKTLSGSSLRSISRVRRLHPGVVLRTAGGVLLALLLAELALRPWNSLLYWVNVHPVAEDSLNAPVVTVRTYDEGIATAHFTPSSARLTGNVPSPNAPYLLIVGDSFVAATQVPDRATMGAQIEALSERAGHRVNVRQYGWIAASPAKYIVEAPQLRAMWHPAMTVVLLSLDDFVPEALDDHWTSITFNKDAPASVVRVSPVAHSKSHEAMQQLALRSALLHNFLGTFSTTLWPRLRQLAASFHPVAAAAQSAGPQTTAISRPDIIRNSVRELHRAYGDNLLLLYLSQPQLETLPDATETDLLATCKEQRIECLSTRSEFLQARDSGRFLAAGFANSNPGAGHYNADGHKLIAEKIWSVLSRRQQRTW